MTDTDSSGLVFFHFSNMTTSCVIAIDFGTAYSGYCFCLKANPSEIRITHWGEGDGVKSLKTPTCILFDEDGTFLDFGYDALMTYKRMGQNNKSFFNHFKMQLYNKVSSLCVPYSG